MMFSKDYNEILNEILTLYKNMTPIEQLDVIKLKAERPDIYAQYLTQSRPDTSVGTILFMRAACQASMEYGIRKTADKIVDQFFVETAVRRYLEQHASDYGVTTIGKTDSVLSQELAELKRGRKMGGNRYDYIEWAKSVSVDYVVANPASNIIINTGFAEFDAAAVVDSNTIVKAWSTDSVIAGANIHVNLDTIRRAYTKIRLYMSGAGSTTTYEISYSDNDLDWTVAGTITPSLAGWNETAWTVSASHRYWKITLTNAMEIGPYVTEMELWEGPETVSDADVFKLAQGEGTFDIVITSNLARGIATQDLMDAVYEKVSDSRTVCSGFEWGLRVLTGELLSQDIVLSGIGSNWDKGQTIDDIIAYTDLLTIGQTLYRSQLESIAVQNGADSASVVVPATDIVPVVNTTSGIYQVIRSDAVSIL